MPTTVTRIPDEVLHGAKAIASLQGKTTNEVLVEAWQEYLESHRDEIAANVERAAGLQPVVHRLLAGQDRLTGDGRAGLADRSRPQFGQQRVLTAIPT